MSYSHNMLTPSDIFSGFDPVAGEVDGTTIGITYVVRQIFGGLTAFDSNIQEITASNTACPTWLKSVSGNLLGNTSKTNVSQTDFLRFFRLNDPGLTASVPNCITYKMKNINSPSNNRNHLYYLAEFAVSGVGIKSSASANADNSNNSFWRLTTQTNILQSLYHIPFGTTTTTMSNIPSVIFWKSNNSLWMSSVKKTDGTNVGGGCISLHPQFSGYTLTGSVSGEIKNGTNANIVALLALTTGCVMFDGFTTYIDESSVKPSTVSILSSVQKLPSVALSLSGNLRLISSKLAIAGQPDNNVLTAVSQEIDNVYLINALIYNNGTIVLYDSKYWLVVGYVHDGNRPYGVILQLSG